MKPTGVTPGNQSHLLEPQSGGKRDTPMILPTAPRFLSFGIIFSGDYALWLHPRLYSIHAYGVSVCMLRESRNKKIEELLHDAEGMAGQNRLPM